MSDILKTQKTVDLLIRLGLLFGLLYWCFILIAPFLLPFLWAIIIAIALHPLHELISNKLRFGRKMAAIVLTVIMVVGIIFPAYGFFATVTSLIIQLKASFESGAFHFPKMQDQMRALPLVGGQIDAIMKDININLKDFLMEHKDTILQLFQKLAGIAVNTGISLFMVIVAMILAGVLLAFDGLEDWSKRLFNRIIGPKGFVYAELSASTIRNVVKGVLGVAVIQTILAGIGLSLAGIPHAPLWTIVVLILTIVQVGPLLVLAGASIFLFMHESTTVASLWTGYFVMVTLVDNILKPILLGKSSQVPTLVIFLGVIGGFMMSGFIGLFTGAIVLSIGYTLAAKWMEETQEEIEESVS
jgi:predicted PurR-regulated permease PerM